LLKQPDKQKVTSAGNTEPLHLTTGFYYSPRFSPDGKRLAFFMVDGQGHADIWVKDLERDNTSRLASMGASWPTWTPTARTLSSLREIRQLWGYIGSAPTARASHNG
jgi:Tol biopolymer transport system component